MGWQDDSVISPSSAPQASSNQPWLNDQVVSGGSSTSNATISPNAGKDTPSFNDKYLQNPNNPGVLREGSILARSASPYLAAAGTGAGMAALASSIVPMAEPIAIPTGAMAGMGAYGASQLYNLLANIGNKDLGANGNIPTIPDVRDYTDKAADAVGFAKRDTYSLPERYISTGADMVGNVASGAGLGSTLLKTGVPALKGLGTALTSNIGQQLLAAQGAGVAGQSAAEVGITDPAAQLAIGMAGAHAPLVLKNAFVPHAESSVSKMQADPNVVGPNSEKNIGILNADIAARENAAKQGFDVPNTMTGQLLQNPYWKNIEAREAGDLRVGENKTNNDVKMAKGITQVVAPPEGYENNLTPVLNEFNKQKIDAAQAQADVAQKAVEAGNKNVKNIQRTTEELPDQLGATSSEAAIEKQRGNYDAAKTEVKPDWDKVDNTQPADYTQAAEGVNQVIKEASINELREGKIPKDIKKVQKELATHLNEDGSYNGPVGKLIAWSQDLGDAQHEALLKGKRTKARFLGLAKQAIDGSMETASESNDALQTAKANYKAKVADVFLNDTQGKATNESFQDSQYLGKSLGTVEDARQLKKALKYETDPEAQQNVRDHFMDQLAQKTKGKAISDSVLSFIRSNKAILAEFPKVKEEMLGYANKLGDGEGKVLALTKELQDRQDNLKATQTTVEKSVENEVARDPVNYWKKFFGETKNTVVPIEQLKEVKAIKDAIASDSTGKAQETYVNSLKEYLNSPQGLKMKGTPADTPEMIAKGESSTDTLKVSNTRLIEMLTPKSPGRAVLEAVLGKEKVGEMDHFYNAAKKEAANVNSGIHGSPTQPNEAKAAEASKPSVAGAVKAGAFIALKHSTSRLTANALGHLGMAAQKILSGDDSVTLKKLQVDALFDKKLAAALMTDPKSASGPAATKIIKAWQDQNTGTQGPVRKALIQVSKNAPVNKTARYIGGVEGSMSKKRNDLPEENQ